MTSMDDMHRMMHDEQESHDEYMRRAVAARDEGNWEMGSMFEKIAHDEAQHVTDMSHMVEQMGGEKAPFYPSMPTSVPAMEYYWAVQDRTSGEKTTDGTRYDYTNVATAAARKYITEDLAVREDILGHDIDIEVYISAPDVRGFTIGDPFHTEKYIHLETTPLYPSMPTSLLGGAGMPMYIPGTGGKHPVPTTYGMWIDLSEDIKDKYPLDSPERAEVNFQLGILLELEEGRPDDAKRWLVNKAGEVGIQ